VDTRSKILTAADARQIAGSVLLATGYFDVLREEHVREVEALASQEGNRQAGGRLQFLVAVLPFEGALLDQRARAELVAGLRMVDYVIAASDSEVDELIRTLHPRRIVRLESEHIRLARELRERVHHRRENPTPAR
jgi:bifunctional ADP-heptose synthase (sugar kinase/adenylyltransferase)